MLYSFAGPLSMLPPAGLQLHGMLQYPDTNQWPVLPQCPTCEVYAVDGFACEHNRLGILGVEAAYSIPGGQRTRQQLVTHRFACVNC